MDCATKHRQFGVTISFVKSVSYDKWTKKLTLFMELGGNSNFLELIKKYESEIMVPQSKIIDYKSNLIKNYKLELAKKVEVVYEELFPSKKEEKPQEIVSPKKENIQQEKKETKQENKEQEEKNNVIEKPKVIEEPEKVVKPQLNFFKPETNQANTTGISSSSKSKIKGKKIQDIDFKDLAIDDSKFSVVEKKNDMMVQPNNSSQKKESIESTNIESKPIPQNIVNTNPKENAQNQEKLKKLENAKVKSISSDSFFKEPQVEDENNKEKFKQFSNVTSLSSNQFFGIEEEQEKPTISNTLKTVIFSTGTQIGSQISSLKNKAGNYIQK